MSLKHFLVSKVFLKHLGLAIAIAITILFTTLLWLSIFTRHGQSRPVPDLYGLTIEEAEKTVKENKMRFEVIDSVYTNIVPRGYVLEQNPVAGFNVKKNRRIMVTINAFQPEMIEMPDLLELSKRQAIALIESSGLELGKLNYKPDLSIDYVLEQLYHGKPVKPGDSIQKGSVIDLVLGKGLSNRRTPMPELIGLGIKEARDRILASSLNIGTFTFDNTINTAEDSAKAFVFKQNPVYSEDMTLQLGSSVYVWFTTDSMKLPIDSTMTELPDTLFMRGIN
ncbi:MAG TPA: PASTA domain-containing protein [Bacteroidetes bacterium]|nr:PASTA domain-containing protein [Bacteroidota bacterium]